MEKPFNLPPLGENVSAGTVVGILVAVGDTLAVNQATLEIETDKANLEVPSTVAGVVTEILVKIGDKAQVGAPVLMVEEGAAAAQPPPPTEAPTPASSTPPRESVPVSAAPAPASAPEPSSPPPGPVAVPSSASSPVADGTPVPAAPSVRRFAREIGIDIRQVPGTGPGGRISVENVKVYAKQLNTGRVAMPAGHGLPVVSLPDFSKWGDTEREPMSSLRRTAAEHLSTAWVSIPHVTYADKADVTELEKLRKQLAPRVEAVGGKLTMTAIALKITAAALKKFPLFNASLDMAKQEIVYKKYYHIGVAVDTDRGLVVPVIRDVDKKNIATLCLELSQIAEKARNKKLTLEDMQGQTFTISNLGGFGGTFFTPIVNAPDVAILGIARGRTEPVYVDGQFQPRLMLPLMISYDHRVIDGADGARFMQWLVQAFEQPILLSLEG
ncbi:MAG: 2-oxo acid dehydrogenase subunit E2 [candidate division Zixibacteria bacterium]|nr:2-oxo acid dehydrogenase subunit E2 [candidate division Zixibacteria bacterium]